MSTAHEMVPLYLACTKAKQYLGHEAVVMPQSVDLWVCVEPANGSTVHIAPHKADTDALGLGQVLEASYQIVSLAVMLLCSA